MASKSQQWNIVDDAITADFSTSEGTARHSKSTISKKKQLEYLKAKIAARE
jgi:hypothetical protein